MLKIVEMVNSLGSGAMLGSATLSILRVSRPEFFSQDLGIYGAIAAGALLGAGLQRILAPVKRLCDYYFRLFQLILLSRCRIITERRRVKYVAKLTKRYFDPAMDEDGGTP